MQSDRLNPADGRDLLIPELLYPMEGAPMIADEIEREEPLTVGEEMPEPVDLELAGGRLYVSHEHGYVEAVK